jgi:hypothetical protein
LDVIKGNPYFKDYLDSILNPYQSLTPSYVCVDGYFTMCGIFVYAKGNSIKRKVTYEIFCDIMSKEEFYQNIMTLKKFTKNFFTVII